MNTAPTARSRSRRRSRLGLACGVAAVLGVLPGLAAPDPATPSAILQELRGFREFGTVLLVAAHPDDEDTQLLTYLVRGRNYRAAYLSVTRGDGGQNLLGPEFGEELGVIRTQELLAARRLDGGRQFFTRAIDFGFSKDYRETLRIWDKDEVVSDIVRIMREFRPDVVVTRFSPQPGNTHGHHTASAVLALEAFKLAGDPKAFPDQLKDLTVWQPKRIYMGAGGFGRGGGTAGADTVRVDIGGNDSITGESFGSIAGRSRSMHKTQGFGGGGGGRGGAQSESFQLLAGDPATKDIMDGIDTTWARVPGGGVIGKMADDLVAKFNTNNPSASVPALLAIRSRMADLQADPVVDEKRAQLDHILQECLGLEATTRIPEAEVVPGETMKMDHTAIVHSDVPVRWLGVRYAGVESRFPSPVDLRKDQATDRAAAKILAAGTPMTQPYWLRESPTPGMYRVADPSLIGRPENPATYPVEMVFSVGGQEFSVDADPAAFEAASGVQSKSSFIHRKLDVIPPVSLQFTSDVRLFTPGAAKPVEVSLTAARPNSAGSLNLTVPAGWKVSPSRQSFKLDQAGDTARLTFTVTAPAQPASADITASAEIKGVKYDTSRIVLRYNHIPVQLLQPVASTHVVGLNLAVRGHKIGYLAGAGDSVAEALTEMGFTVTQITGADLTADKLRGFDAVVTGVRAFNTRNDLAANLPALFAWVEAGGTLVEQYNRPGGRSTQFAPFELTLSNDRVTDETAPMTFLAPDHPALNVPNKITAADFDGWVQERGIYFPNRWDDHFVPILACNDPGEQPMKGSLLVAQSGKGYIVYTGLDFFRQLPAGVPGAYRLFANLVSLGK